MAQTYLFPCSSLYHADHLIPSERMLATYAIDDRSSDFLKVLDNREWQVLAKENRRFFRKLSFFEVFGSYVAGFAIGGSSGLCVGVSTWNPIIAVSTGIGAGVATAAAVARMGYIGGQRDQGYSVSRDRLERLSNKISIIQERLEEIGDKKNSKITKRSKGVLFLVILRCVCLVTNRFPKQLPSELGMKHSLARGLPSWITRDIIEESPLKEQDIKNLTREIAQLKKVKAFFSHGKTFYKPPPVQVKVT